MDLDSSSSTDLDARVEVFKTPASNEYGTTGQGGKSTSTSSLSPDNVTPQSLMRKLYTGDSVGSDSPNKLHMNQRKQGEKHNPLCHFPRTSDKAKQIRHCRNKTWYHEVLSVAYHWFEFSISLSRKPLSNRSSFSPYTRMDQNITVRYKK